MKAEDWHWLHQMVCQSARAGAQIASQGEEQHSHSLIIKHPIFFVYFIEEENRLWSNSSWFVFPWWHVFTKSKLKCWHKSTTFKFVENVAGCANCSYFFKVYQWWIQGVLVFLLGISSRIMINIALVPLVSCLVYFLDSLSFDPCPFKKQLELDFSSTEFLIS